MTFTKGLDRTEFSETRKSKRGTYRVLAVLKELPGGDVVVKAECQRKDPSRTAVGQVQYVTDPQDIWITRYGSMAEAREDTKAKADQILTTKTKAKRT